jgi:hypothetical protein
VSDGALDRAHPGHGTSLDGQAADLKVATIMSAIPDVDTFLVP